MEPKNKNPFLLFLDLVGDLVWINVLTAVCCLPILTAGAALTAMHHLCRNVAEGDDLGLTRSFFRSFRENFRQATILWLALLLVGLFLGADLYLMGQEFITIPSFFRGMIYIACFLAAFFTMPLFPSLARFQSTLRGTLKNSAIIAILQAPKTVLAMVLTAAPFVGMFCNSSLAIFAMFFGLSAPAYIYALMYRKLFARLAAPYVPGDENEEEL